MNPSVRNVFAGEDFVLFIDFDNGEQGKLDMKPFHDCGFFRGLKTETLLSGFALPLTLSNGTQWLTLTLNSSTPSVKVKNMLIRSLLVKWLVINDPELVVSYNHCTHFEVSNSSRVQG
jgi:hypothetical protein